MVIVNKAEEGKGLEIRGKVGRPANYGRKRNGWVFYGEEKNPKWGIYRIFTQTGTQKQVKCVFYIPTNPQTEAQQANRNKFINALTEWNALTDEEKEVYNEKAKGKSMTGYNVFVKEYMLS